MARLILMPNTLDLGCEPVPLSSVLPQAVIEQAARLEHWVAEDAKSARAFLKRVRDRVPLSVPLQSLDIRELPRHGGSAWDELLRPLVQGHDLGLISEAGLPGVADPGSELVGQAHRQGFEVLPLSGPNSLMMALAASGLHGQSFAFVGYLPQDPAARAARIRELLARSQRERQTQLLIETPYRNAAVMSALVEHLAPSTPLAVACGLTLPQGWCRTQTVAQWKRQAPVFEKGLPAVFSFLGM